MLVAEKPSEKTTRPYHRSIRKVAVLGSGVMGSRIACHFANIGVEVLLLDIVPRELTPAEQAKGLSLTHPAVRNRLVNEALTAAVKGKPAALFVNESAQLIKTGNFDDDFEKIADCDLILEAVVERLDIKKIIFEKVDKYRKPGSIITSNTSGIPIHMIAEGRSEDFRKHFLGTHFFNPPRYLRLLEIIPGPDTDPGLVAFLKHYGDLFLGKETVLCKDTPAFIANRVGIYAMAKIFQLVEEMGLTIEEVDLLTGPATGKPKTGTFRLSDLVGLDTTVHVLNGINQNCPNDEEKNLFKAPGYVQKMVENKWLGDKTGQGFYKKSQDANGERIILSLDLNTLEYRENIKPEIASLKLIKNTTDLGKKLRTLFTAEDKGGEFVRRSSLALFAYVSNRLPEIADHLYQIDDAIRAGFGWDKGPFENWDMIGVADTMDKFASEGVSPAAWVKEMLAAGHTTFYKTEGGVRKYYDISAKSYQTIPGTESLILLDNLREEKRIWSNNDASVIDLGDGVLNVEFHSKMNSIGEGTLKAIHYAIDYAEQNSYNGVVIANEAPNFSVGANIMLMLMMATQGEWEQLDLAVRTFQNTSMRIRTSAVPVVIAPHAMTLGGGCEFTLHSDVAVASAETYIGLVEVGVGLIPGGGGTKEMALRASLEYSKPGALGVGVLEKYLMNIATAKVATSAAEARGMDIFRSTDKISMNSSRRIKDAKDTVLELAAAGYVAPKPRTDIPVLGKNTLGTLYAAIAGMQYGHYASAHDALIARKIAWVLCGGDLSGDGNKVSEQYLLDIEREAFLSLTGEKKTMERMQYMLQTGKPLRN
ncbi:MAG: 3-hydroxyacyl-CoA dehydrogenase NAD-binding domain-containing protein [Bacteroidia bacterium]|nr:3-hydroxyacyl-CoA dehydrogenase NAD-binding domain-containing protein [Bacteroidia bacterium]